MNLRANLRESARIGMNGRRPVLARDPNGEYKRHVRATRLEPVSLRYPAKTLPTNLRESTLMGKRIATKSAIKKDEREDHPVHRVTPRICRNTHEVSV